MSYSSSGIASPSPCQSFPTSLPLPQACTSLEVDIISLDLTQRLGMKLKAAAVKAAMKRGIHFEVGRGIS